ncbi:hypothetical protein PIB30_058192 [Stylosanthes scabra]|uniref:Uncharacterized protein n=1 Tax=Stylosanthes scabra TaxID=79078 RepID=A0ABU6XKL2_9FABA|nr:hypothetical protein [Stylosanthes scabra]
MFAADTTSCFAAEFQCYANPSHVGLYRWGHDREEVAALVVLLRGLDGAHTLADGQTQVGGGNHAHIPALLHFLPHFLLLLEALGDPHLHRLAAGVGLVKWIRMALITGISDLLEDGMVLSFHVAPGIHRSASTLSSCWSCSFLVSKSVIAPYT